MKRQLLRGFDLCRAYRFERMQNEGEKAILVVGSPRSGTTWLMRVLSSLTNACSIFEPLHGGWYPEAAVAGFEGRLFLEPGREWGQGKGYLEKVVSGTVVGQSPRLGYGLRENLREAALQIVRGLSSRNIVVKLVRATRLLPWLADLFPTCRVVYVVRSPLSTIGSQLRTKVSGYNLAVDGFLDCLRLGNHPPAQVLLAELEGIPFLPSSLAHVLESRIGSWDAFLALAWCLDNIIPARYAANGNWVTVRYDEIVCEFDEQLRFLLNALDIREREELSLPARILPRASQAQRDSWKRDLSSQQIGRIEDILGLFAVGPDGRIGSQGGLFRQ